MSNVVVVVPFKDPWPIELRNHIESELTRCDHIEEQIEKIANYLGFLSEQLVLSGYLNKEKVAEYFDSNNKIEIIDNDELDRRRYGC